MSDWDEANHPRVPKGQVNGGQFTDKQLKTAELAARLAADLNKTFGNNPDMEAAIQAQFDAGKNAVWNPVTCRYEAPWIEERGMQVVPELADLDHERAYIFDLAEGEVRKIEGTDNQVPMDTAQKALLGHSLFLHNHPGGNRFARFSTPDLDVIRSWNVQEAWVISGDYIIKARRPEGSWKWDWSKVTGSTDVVDNVAKEVAAVGEWVTKAFQFREDWYHDLAADDDKIRDAIVSGYRNSGFEAEWVKWR